MEKFKLYIFYVFLWEYNVHTKKCTCTCTQIIVGLKNHKIPRIIIKAVKDVMFYSVNLSIFSKI